MSIIAYEDSESPEIDWAANGSGSRAVRMFNVLGTQDEAVAIGEALAIAPLVILVGGDPLLRTHARTKTHGFDTWKIAVEYVPDDDENQTRQRPQPGTYRFRVDATGGTQKITYSKKPPLAFAERTGADVPPNLNKMQAIGWDGKDVQGTDVPWPQVKFEIEGWYQPQFFTTAFVAGLAAHVPSKNKKKYLGFDAGELLYLGPTGQGEMPTVSGQRVKPVQCVHHFATSANTPAYTIDSQGSNYSIEIPKKKGWDVLSIYVEPVLDPTEKYFEPVPKYAWVHEVIEDADFAQLLRFGGPA